MPATPDASPPGEPVVSVIISLYGRHRGIETLPGVARLWLDQDVPCEVVVGVAADSYAQVVDQVAGIEGLRFVQVRAKGDRGLLSNLAVRESRSPMIYLSDADIAPVGRGYLRRALDLAGESRRPVVQPWMYRLVASHGWQDVTVWTAPAGRVCFVTVDDGRLVPVPGERLFNWRGAGSVIVPPSAKRPSDPWQAGVLPHFHAGAVFLERELFDEIGGFCPGYLGYGGEDDDLLIKVASRRPTTTAWLDEPGLACLHFEHPRPYGGSASDPNRDLLAARTAMGAAEMIRADVASARGQR
jgi:hypothetical protein